MEANRPSRSEIGRLGGLASAASLNQDQRCKRAAKAAKSAAKNRRSATKERDKNISIAFRYLSNEALTKDEALKAIIFLTECGNGVNLPRDAMGPYLFLARATGLTKQRIWAIVKRLCKK